MSVREPPEVRFASKGKTMENEVRRIIVEQDRKSAVRKRQIDRNIYLTTQELNDIQTRTPSPTRGTGGATLAPPHITISDVDQHHHNDNDSSHSSQALSNSNCAGDLDPDPNTTRLVHLRARTRRNLLLSQKLSRSLEVMDKKRAQSSRTRSMPPDAANPRERGPEFRPVSSRSMEDLQRAAAVLRFTEHEDMVQQLLSSVSLKGKVSGDV